MDIDVTSPRTRRALLTTAVGTAAAAAAATVVRAAPAAAADGDNLTIGQDNQGSGMTTLTTPGLTSFTGKSTSSAGVHGQSVTDVGLFGSTTGGGFGLGTFGRIKIFNICGVATIKEGKKSVTVNPKVRITAKSFVLLTPKSNIGSRGLWYTTNATKNTITIRMSSTRSGPTKVAWLTLEWRKET